LPVDELEDEIRDGFGQKSGEDCFDAVIGLMSMIEVVLAIAVKVHRQLRKFET
jgi:hypothetical protein